MSDLELQTVRDYVKRGGHAASVGRTAAFDDLARPRKDKSNFLSSPGPAQRYIEKRDSKGTVLVAEHLVDMLPADTYSLERAFQICRDGDLQRPFEEKRDPKYLVIAKLDKLIGIDRLWHGGKLAGFIRDSLGHEPSIADPESALGVRFTPFIKNEGSNRRIVLHVVNYNIPLAVKDESHKVRPVTQLKTELTLPAGCRVQTVVMHDPDEHDTTQLKFRQIDGRLEIEIPAVRIYKLVDITATGQG
jgi:hypothetical protein